MLALDTIPTCEKQMDIFSRHSKGSLCCVFPTVVKVGRKERGTQKFGMQREEQYKGNKFKRMTEKKMRPRSGGMGQVW
jgi:hypothetical protein